MREASRSSVIYADSKAPFCPNILLKSCDDCFSFKATSSNNFDAPSWFDQCLTYQSDFFDDSLLQISPFPTPPLVSRSLDGDEVRLYAIWRWRCWKYSRKSCFSAMSITASPNLQSRNSNMEFKIGGRDMKLLVRLRCVEHIFQILKASHFDPVHDSNLGPKGVGITCVNPLRNHQSRIARVEIRRVRKYTFLFYRKRIFLKSRGSDTVMYLHLSQASDWPNGPFLTADPVIKKCHFLTSKTPHHPAENYCSFNPLP